MLGYELTKRSQRHNKCFGTTAEDFFYKSLLVSEKSIIFVPLLVLIKIKNFIMALEIKPPPVLEGKAAQEFYERWANTTCSKSKEEVQEGMRQTRVFLAKYYNPYKS